MRVLHVIARINLGGTARWLDVLSRELTLSGHEVIVAAGSVDAAEVETEPSQWYSLVRLPHLGRSVSPLNDVLALNSVRSLISDIRPDVVNTHTAKAGVIGRIANASLGSRRAPLVHTVHGHLLHGYFGRAISHAVRITEHEMSRLSDVVLAPGRRVGQELLDARIVKPDQLQIVHPGVVDFGPNSDLGVSKESMTVGWLARMVPIKRPDRLAEVARLTPHVKYLVGGDGNFRMQFEAIDTPNVTTLGWVNANEFWSRCDVAVLTSDNEAMPYSIIEAALAGLPAVTTDAGSASEVVVDGVTGFVVPRSAQKIADAIQIVAQDDDLRMAMGVAAREFALETFSPLNMLLEHLQAYGDAINKRA